MAQGGVAQREKAMPRHMTFARCPWMQLHMRPQLYVFSSPLNIDADNSFYKARFVLSDQESLTAGGKQKGRWPYEAFYDAIISIVNAMPSDDFDELITWWNEYVHNSLPCLLFITSFPELFLVICHFRRTMKRRIQMHRPWPVWWDSNLWRGRRQWDRARVMSSIGIWMYYATYEEFQEFHCSALWQTMTSLKIIHEFP